MREFRDDQGRAWQAVALDAVVAHGRQGAVLAFRPGEQPEAEPLRGSITFNSMQAASLAINTMSEMELRRRLSLALSAAGGP